MHTKTMVDANGIAAISNAMIQHLSKAGYGLRDRVNDRLLLKN